MKNNSSETNFKSPSTCGEGLGGVIFDPLRRKHVALTPEERVRQSFVSYLITQLHYSPSLMGNEVSLTLNGMSRRCDTVVYSRHDARPLMIIEYKAPTVAITQKVFEQIARYNAVLQVSWLIVSNGRTHYCCQVNPNDGTWQFCDSIPTWEKLQNP